MNGTTRRRRVVVLVLAVLFGVFALSAVPATAHTRTQETTNLDSRITSDPQLPGVTWKVYAGGSLIEVVNRSDQVLIIEGYKGEPYLRVGPGGVEHNRRSPATYLNDDRIGRRVSTRTGVAMPPDADPNADPEWIRVGTEPLARWHDHRVHWMSSEPPDFVEAGPLARAMMRVNLVGVIGRAGDDAGVFQRWSVPLTFAGETTAVGGEMAWVDPPSATPWLVLGSLLVAPALLGLRRSDPEAILRPAAITVLVVTTVNGIHLVDDLISWPSEALDELFGLLHTGLFLGAGVGGSFWALRVRYGRVLALSIASGGVLYHQGFVHLPMLQASSFPTVWPDQLVRLTIAAALLQALVVGAVVVRAREVGAGRIAGR